MVEVHTVELPKYDLEGAAIREATKIEQWVFLLLYAEQYTAEQLRALLPGVEFDQAITVIETISQKTKDRMMYDQREKALRDQRWLMEGALERGREEGREEGLEKGREKGREEGLGVGLEKGRVIGTISTLRGILGEAASAESELEKLSIEELTRLCADLQDRLRTRGDS